MGLALLAALVAVAATVGAELHIPSIVGSTAGKTPGKAKARPDVPTKGSRPHQLLLARRFRAEAKRKGRAAQVVFIGDSITEHMRGSSMGKVRSDRSKERVWARERYHRAALFFGVAHEETQHVLWRLQGGELDAVRPRVVVVLIGTNNLGIGKMTPEDAARGILAVARAVHAKAPGALVLVQALLPRGPDWPGGRFGATVAEVNDRVAQEVGELAGLGQPFQYVDCNAWLLEKGGRMSRRLMPDSLHPSTEGHRKWAECLRPHIQTALDGDGGP